MLPIPLWRRNRTGRLTWVNAAYARAVEAESQEAVLASGIELLPSARARRSARRRASAKPSTTALGDRRRRAPAAQSARKADRGRQGRRCARRLGSRDGAAQKLTQVTESNARTLDQLAAGVAVFGRDGRILFHNAAFRSIWGLSAEWLASRPEESAILDQLRSERKLPEQSNYRDWRAKTPRRLSERRPREDFWHLPGRRTLRVVAVPNSDGGMSYIYENVTEQIALESRLAALSQLQGETLDHLSEAVAVFGTDGRLRLFNPVFADIWRLSPTQLQGRAAYRRDHRHLPGDLFGQVGMGRHPHGGHQHRPRGQASAGWRGRTAASSTMRRSRCRKA